MSSFINKEKAMEYLETIQDPIVRGLILRAYATLIFEVNPCPVEGQFDLLFFFHVLEMFLRDRESLAKGLRGEFDTQ